jgi:hypothetical protein
LPLGQIHLINKAAGNLIKLKKLFRDADPRKGQGDFFSDSLQMVNSAYEVIESQESQCVEKKSCGLD